MGHAQRCIVQDFLPTPAALCDHVGWTSGSHESSFAQCAALHESTPLLRVLTGAAFGWFTAWFGIPTIEESVSDSRPRLEMKAAIERQAS